MDTFIQSKNNFGALRHFLMLRMLANADFQIRLLSDCEHNHQPNKGDVGKSLLTKIEFFLVILDPTWTWVYLRMNNGNLIRLIIKHPRDIYHFEWRCLRKKEFWKCYGQRKW